MKTSRIIRTAILAVVIVGGTLVFTHRQGVYDWMRLRGYQPPVAISKIATDDTMTDYGRHMFYINHPNLTADKQFFNKQCGGKEQTIVLGCYHGEQQGIYLYAVSDARLKGVEQVTAAHEMLHAAYDRLSAKERTGVDKMLQDFYDRDLTDKRIRDNIDLYKKIEPNDVVNEMHSIFGTEIANLPTPLENYYKKYFDNRPKIAQFAVNYQGAFTSLQNQVTAYDAQLSQIKSQVELLRSTIDRRQQELATQKTQMDAARAAGNISTYNAQVAPYNAAVNSYNAQVVELRNLISQYNAIVDQRNAIAVQENELTQALSSNTDTMPAQ